jgi:hypothetical protein
MQDYKQLIHRYINNNMPKYNDVLILMGIPTHKCTKTIMHTKYKY